MSVVSGFVATPAQERLFAAMSDGSSRIIGFGGAIRGTKTYGVIAAVILLCRMYPGSRWCFVRKDLQRLRDTTIPSFAKFLMECMAGSDFVGELNQDRWERVCRNGSVILFRGENLDKDPELLRAHGYEVNGFANEEADELSERMFAKEIERAGTWIIPGRALSDQPPAYIFNTFNPCATWPRSRFYVPWRDGTMQAPYAFIPASPFESPYVSEAQFAAWKEMPENEYKRFVLQDWDALPGAYYDTVTSEILIDREQLPDPLPSHWRYWGSYDWGTRHWGVFGAWVTDEDGTDFLLDSVWMRGLQDDEQAVEILRDAPSGCMTEVYAGHDCWGKFTAHAASGVSTADVFAESRILLVKADTDKVNGGKAVNRQVKDGKVKIVKTPGNLKGFDQLCAIMPDEVDIRKPMKVDADPEGKGGDDFADMFRYGIATKIARAKALSANKDGKQPHRANQLVVKGGKVVKPVKAPSNAAEMAAWADERASHGGRVPHKERIPRRHYR